MTISVLIVDADEEYRELTAKTLKSTGQYKPFVAQTAQAALSLQSEAKPQIAIVDTALPDMDGIEFIRHLRQSDKHLLIIAIVEDEAIQSTALEPFDVRSILEKPYYLPELPVIIKSAIQGPTRKATTAPKAQQTPAEVGIQVEQVSKHWLYDADQASDFLTRLFNEHSARALMIMRGRSPWARSVQLSDIDSQSVAKLALENVPQGNPLESIVRYTRLNELEGDLLLYTTPIMDEFVLVMLYDSEKSFSLARRQAKYLTGLILTQDPADLPPMESSPTEEEVEVPSIPAGDSTLPDDWIPQSPASVQDLPQLSEVDVHPPAPEAGRRVDEASSTSIPSDMPPLPTDWFPKRPMPSAHLPFLAQEEVEHSGSPEGPAAPEKVELSGSPEGPAAPEKVELSGSSEGPAAPEKVELSGSPEGPAAPEKVELSGSPEGPAAPEKVELSGSPEGPAAPEKVELSGSPEGPTAPEEVDRARPTERSEAPQVHYEARIHLPFSAVLLPQNRAHKLDDALAEVIGAWLKDICLAWGWRANNIHISPRYLHLTVYLSPEIAPSDAIQRVSNALSEKILAANPQFSDDLTAGQFWATHYLLIAGEGIESDRINTFIQAVRQDAATGPLADT